MKCKLFSYDSPMLNVQQCNSDTILVHTSLCFSCEKVFRGCRPICEADFRLWLADLVHRIGLANELG